MKAIIKEYQGHHLDRISQLVNKTNQFNLTNRRYSSSNISSFIESEDYIVMFGNLNDKFAEYGVISVIVCKVLPLGIEIDTWVMSCRVFKRGMEFAMFDELVRIASKLGKIEINGEHIPSAKNSIVSDLYSSLGFKLVEDAQSDSDKTLYKMSISNYLSKNNTIEVINE